MCRHGPTLPGEPLKWQSSQILGSLHNKSTSDGTEVGRVALVNDVYGLLDSELDLQDGLIFYWKKWEVRLEKHVWRLVVLTLKTQKCGVKRFKYVIERFANSQGAVTDTKHLSKPMKWGELFEMLLME